VTSTIESGFVYLPKDASWLATYLHELITFPNAKYDDQADSSAQALDWLRAKSYTCGVFEFYHQEAIRQKLKLHVDYKFVSCEEDDEIVAVHKTTGHKIRWDGRAWVELEGLEEPIKQTCPACGRPGFGTYGERHRCNQCSHVWPVAPLIPPTQRDATNNISGYTTRSFL
jgi:hypothetical protein